MMNGKRALVEAFGQEAGEALYGAAVKLSNRHGVPLDDVIGDMSIAALEVEANYGFYHINTIVNETRAMVYRSYRYGVNEYYHTQGVNVDSLQELVDGDADEALNLVGVGLVTVEDAAVRMDVVDTLEALTRRDRQIAQGLMQGLSGAEIGERLGCSRQYVYKRKRAMREAFGWAVV
jgi:DNA-binding NarL/FixJ family response regulator